MKSLFAPRDASANPAPAEVYNWRIYFLACSAAMGSAMFGYDSAFIGGSLSLPAFKSRFGLVGKSAKQSAALSANIVSTFQAGCFFGAILVYYFTERFGRKFVLMACGAIFNVGAIVQLSSHGTLGTLYAGRALTGLAVGASSLIVPVYISECAPPAIRGRLIGIFECILQFFLVIGFWINYGVNLHISGKSDAQWQIPFGFQLLPGTLLIILMIFQPDSPRWQIKSGKIEQAYAGLSKLRNLPRDHEYLIWEVNMVRHQIEHENMAEADKSIFSKLKEVFSAENRNRLFLGMSLMMLQNLSGINALNYYSPSIFKSIGFSGTTVGLLATGVFGLVKAVVTLLFMLFGIDRLGRRRALLIGSVGGLVAMFYLGIYSELSHSFQSASTHKSGGSYVAILMVYLFAIFYAMSWNGIPWVFCAEIFPTGIRSICLVFTTCTQWLGQFTIVYSTPYMMTNIKFGTFYLFGSSLVIAGIVVFFFMPETKGLSIEEMDILFAQKGLAHNIRKKTDAIISQNAANDVATMVRGDEKSNKVEMEEL